MSRGGQGRPPGEGSIRTGSLGRNRITKMKSAPGGRKRMGQVSGEWKRERGKRETVGVLSADDWKGRLEGPLGGGLPSTKSRQSRRKLQNKA